MGRFTTGDIDYKFMVGVQSSRAADRFGYLGETIFYEDEDTKESFPVEIHYNFDFDHVMFNVKVEFAPALQNEFDILMMKDNHLHVIECKLRKSVLGEDYVYKLDSVIDYLDDDGKGMILVIGDDNKRVTQCGNVKTSFTNGTKARAKTSEILIHHSKTFDKARFLQDVRNHFLS